MLICCSLHQFNSPPPAKEEKNQITRTTTQNESVLPLTQHSVRWSHEAPTTKQHSIKSFSSLERFLKQTINKAVNDFNEAPFRLAHSRLLNATLSCKLLASATKNQFYKNQFLPRSHFRLLEYVSSSLAIHEVYITQTTPIQRSKWNCTHSS